MKESTEKIIILSKAFHAVFETGMGVIQIVNVSQFWNNATVKRMVA